MSCKFFGFERFHHLNSQACMLLTKGKIISQRGGDMSTIEVSSTPPLPVTPLKENK